MKLLRRLRYWLNHRQLDAELAEEMEFHRSQIAPGDATRSMGNLTRMREESRAVWIWPWLESVWQDVTYAIRNLRRQPGFTLVAVLALACAIGVNTSLFTVFNAVALRPWPVKNPARVVNIFSLMPYGNQGTRLDGFSLPEYRYLAEHSRAFSGIIAMRGAQNLKLDDQKAAYSWVSGNFFRVLGVDMQHGRGFLPEEDLEQSPQPLAVLSYATWRDRYGSDPDIVGRQIRLEDVPFTVVGVASRDFTGTSPERVDLWIPYAAAPLVRPHESWIKDLLRNPGDCCVSVAGRLAPAVTRGQARAELTVLSNQFRSQLKYETKDILLTGTPFFNSSPRAKAKLIPIFATMLAGVLLVLVLACANVGNLLLARAAARRQEIAIRISIGASRLRVIRQLMTESAVLAGAAGVAGITLAYRLPSWVFNAAINEPVSLRLEPDATVLSYTLVVSILACIFFGLAPALHGTRTTAARTRLRLRSSLLAVQVAASVILLVGAGLLVRGIQRARVQDPGFAIRDVAVASFELPANSYDAARTRTFFTQLTNQLEQIPELQPVGLALTAPLSSAHHLTAFQLPGEDVKQDHLVLFQEVSAGYFEVLRLPMVAGRNFMASDAARNAILINETMARRYWSIGTAVGKTIVIGSSREIVGVVKDAYITDLDKIEPMIFQPISGRTIPQVLIRANASGVTQQIASVAVRLDARARVQVTPLSENLNRWLAPVRVGAQIATGLGILALALATIGMFGVFTYWVQQRTQEIGIRMALGARPRQVIRVILGTSSRAVLIGLVIGFAGSILASRMLRSFLFGLSPLDPIAYAGVALVLAIASLAATYWPARRATRIDPITALRYE